MKRDELNFDKLGHKVMVPILVRFRSYIQTFDTVTQMTFKHYTLLEHEILYNIVVLYLSFCE